MSPPVIFMIGCGEGIGSSIAKCFATQGFSLGLIAKSQQILDLTTSMPCFNPFNVKISTETTDTTSFKGVKRALELLEEDMGGPDVVVYNVSDPGKLHDESLVKDAATQESLEHLKACIPGALATAQWAVKNMESSRPKGKKTLIFTCDIGVSSKTPAAEAARIACGRRALRTLANSFHDQYRDANIHVAAVVFDGRLKSNDPKCRQIAEQFLRIYQEDTERSKEILYRVER